MEDRVHRVATRFDHAARFFAMSVLGSVIVLQLLVMNLLVGGGDETLEQGVGLVRFAAKFRMKLRSDEPGVVCQFNDFNQSIIS